MLSIQFQFAAKSCNLPHGICQACHPTLKSSKHLDAHIWDDFQFLGTRHDIVGTKIKRVQWWWLVYLNKLKFLLFIIDGLGNIADRNLFRSLGHNIWPVKGLTGTFLEMRVVTPPSHLNALGSATQILVDLFIPFMFIVGTGSLPQMK